jgi:fructose-bisphosphate aldolase, class II
MEEIVTLPVILIPMTYKDIILEAKSQKRAVGHFNISNIEGLNAIFQSAKALNLPVIIGVSEGERDFIGVKQSVALVRSLREEHNYPIFINADHTYSLERVKEAVDAGFDSVIMDNAKLGLDENIALTRQAVEYAKSKNPNVLIEAELGYIGQSSKELDAVPEGVTMTTVEDATKFVKETGVDLFAPAIGNIHGMLKNAPEPELKPDLAKAIADATGVPLVLHGASGNTGEEIRACIEGGVAIVHINTEVRVAYRDALKKQIAQHPDEVAPYKIMKPSIEAMKAVVTAKLRLFNNC